MTAVALFYAPYCDGHNTWWTVVKNGKEEVNGVDIIYTRVEGLECEGQLESLSLYIEKDATMYYISNSASEGLSFQVLALLSHPLKASIA